jgi:hypothetical protein
VIFYEVVILKPRNRKMILTVAVLLLAITGFLAVLFYPTICFLRHFQNGKALPFCTTPVVKKELEVPQVGASVQIFTPDITTHSTLIIVPGLHPQGIYDERFQAFANSCAESGFTVVAPDVMEFRKFQVSSDSVSLITRLVDSLPEILPNEALQNVGLLGISYGGGPVLVAASQQQMKSKIHFVVSIGGYYDLLHAMEYSITGKHPGGGTRPPPPHQWGRMIFALNQGSLAPPADEPLLHEILMLRLNLKEEEAKKLEHGLSPQGQQFLNDVLNGLDSEEMIQFKKMLQHYSEVSKKLSPRFIIQNFPPDLRIYVIHGLDDSLIPSAETEELVSALRVAHHSKTESLITLTLNHVDPAQKESWSDEIPLMVWTRKFLGEARR